MAAAGGARAGGGAGADVSAAGGDVRAVWESGDAGVGERGGGGVVNSVLRRYGSPGVLALARVCGYVAYAGMVGVAFWLTCAAVGVEVSNPVFSFGVLGASIAATVCGREDT